MYFLIAPQLKARVTLSCLFCIISTAAKSTHEWAFWLSLYSFIHTINRTWKLIWLAQRVGGSSNDINELIDAYHHTPLRLLCLLLCRYWVEQRRRFVYTGSGKLARPAKLFVRCIALCKNITNAHGTHANLFVLLLSRVVVIRCCLSVILRCIAIFSHLLRYV